MADSQRKTANLFSSTWEQGGINAVTGLDVIDNNMVRTAGFIPIQYNTIYSMSRDKYSSYMNVRLYDANKNYIGIGTDETIEIIAGGTESNPMRTGQNFCCFKIKDVNTSFIRFNDASNDITTKYMMVEGQYTPSTISAYEPYGWVHSLRKLGTSTDTITTLPADLYADGQSATVGLVGNMSQTGTPTPSNPIQPQECGERTGNLWDEDYEGISQYLTYKPIYLGDGQYTLSTNIHFTGGTANIFFLAGNVSSGASTATNGVYDGQSRTVTSVEGYVTIVYRNLTENPKLYNTMLNTGSTALPYEPYGYKIPISSASTTTPVYLGEVESERQIKKYEFTGQENWNFAGEGTQYAKATLPLSSEGTAISSHFVYGSANTTGQFDFYGVNIRFNAYGVADSVTEWKSYLAQQYAAETPVCVWYVLATETTGIVNEPLRKIGDYADTVSGITIPTITGKDSFDVLTTLKPSEVSLAYTGWHDATVKEWDGSEWN